MRPVLYVLSFLAVMALGFWAYRENYATQAALRDVTDIQNEIGALRESLAIERAEWAYLNRPDRLRDLGTLNFDRLELLPMLPSQFGVTAQIAFPPAPLITNLAVEGGEMVSGTLATAEGAQTP